MESEEDPSQAKPKQVLPEYTCTIKPLSVDVDGVAAAAAAVAVAPAFYVRPTRQQHLDKWKTSTSTFVQPAVRVEWMQGVVSCMDWIDRQHPSRYQWSSVKRGPQGSGPQKECSIAPPPHSPPKHRLPRTARYRAPLSARRAHLSPAF